MGANGDFLRATARTIVEKEAEYARHFYLTATSLKARQLRLTEAELAHRVRSAFDDLDTFLNAQGKAADRDIVSDSRACEIEVKYYCGTVPQGGGIPLSDWRWLVGLERRSPVRNYERLAITFFPRGRVGVAVQGQYTPDVPGTWLFQACLSFTAINRPASCPYWPVTKSVVPRSVVDGRELEPKLSFDANYRPNSVICSAQEGVMRYIRADVVGSLFEFSIWALVHEVIDEQEANALRTEGYVWLE